MPTAKKSGELQKAPDEGASKAPADAQQQTGPDLSPPEGVSLLPPGQGDGGYKPADETEEFLYGPTQRPNESVFAGAARPGRTAPPADLGRWLPKLLKAAQSPDAPPELHAFIRRIRDALEND
jgi:hypothetical protein